PHDVIKAFNSNPVTFAKEHVVRHVNHWLGTGGQTFPTGSCRFSGCRFTYPRMKVKPHVNFAIELNRGPGPRSGLGEYRHIPDSLISTIWLRFAYLITGERALRPCEVCGGLMDISSSKRKKSRRVHPRCGQRRSMQRYRNKGVDK